MDFVVNFSESKGMKKNIIIPIMRAWKMLIALIIFVETLILKFMELQTKRL